MTGQSMQIAGRPNFAIVLADYRFCADRLRVLQRAPSVNRASIAAVLERMQRLAAQWPDLAAHEMLFNA